MTITESNRSNDTAATSRILAGWHETGRADLGSHLSVHGPIPLPGRDDSHFSERLLEAIRRSGLTGRGGAGFPSARKWDSVRRSRHPLLVVNAMEGEPASDKERALLSGAPHLVLDGAQLAAAALGATEIIFCVADDRPDSARRVEDAIYERRAVELEGADVQVLRPPGRYVSGEESALVSWIAGGAATPTFRQQKGVPLTVRRRPTLVHNAETLAHVALIARHGPDWFRAVGLPDAPGTALVSASGSVQRPGVYEVELGTPVRQILTRAGLVAPLCGVLVGGYGGTWLHPDLLDTLYAPQPLAAAGSSMGAGVLGAVGLFSCGVSETARIATYMAGESAGQCGPCVFGLPAIAGDLTRLARGEGDRSSLARLRHRLDAVAGRGACRHPDGVVRLVRSALAVFAADFEEHARHRPCQGCEHSPVLRVPRSFDRTVRPVTSSGRRG
ncbi:MAG TPA: NADH-ubiquinone oxidoreductase-F iron-sulfur binding region domain-containing protein [Acidimicrobiales bacterium]|nr:NADH-ubiquinone oxidoreductase-F iron-sulfur binding region domain-containing protein [Acidimicrobiales bacterium]